MTDRETVEILTALMLCGERFSSAQFREIRDAVMGTGNTDLRKRGLIDGRMGDRVAFVTDEGKQLVRDY